MRSLNMLRKMLFLTTWLLAVLACSFPGFGAAVEIEPSATPTEAPDLLSPTAPVPSPEPSATPEHTPTASPTPTEVLTPTVTSIPCNWAGFISDVTYPDDTVVGFGQAFVKTWRLKNLGSCTWNADYDLVFQSGDSMGAPASVPLPGTVAPGATVDVSVNLTAPGTAGTYQGFFKLRSGDNQLFGIGGGAQGNFWVRIQAGTTTSIVVKVFKDDSGEGTWDPGEDPIESAPAELHYGPCAGFSVDETVDTNAQGEARFVNLDPGVYCVRVDRFSIPGGSWDSTTVTTKEFNLSEGEVDTVTMGFEKL